MMLMLELVSLSIHQTKDGCKISDSGRNIIRDAIGCVGCQSPFWESSVFNFGATRTFVEASIANSLLEAGSIG